MQTAQDYLAEKLQTAEKSLQSTLREVDYQGHKYTSDGESVWRDGELVIKMLKQIKIIDEEKVLSLDGGKNLYFNGKLYYPASHNKELIKKIEGRKWQQFSIDDDFIEGLSACANQKMGYNQALDDVIRLINQE